MVVVYALALLYSNDRILLARRSNVDFAPGHYGLIGGKVEEDERALHAIQREIREETNLDIPEQAFTLVHTLHRYGTKNNLILLIFSADIASMPTPVINEPQKCDDLRFFNLQELPDPMIAAHRQAIFHIHNHNSYSEHGWPTQS